MDAEHCNVCLENHKQCGWEFACEQMYVMAKDVISFDDDSKNNEDYIVFGYNEKPPIKQRSHVFSLDDTQNNMVLGGILSLNRQKTSFVQQMYTQQSELKEVIFAHYFNGNDGYLAFGNDDVNDLKQQLDISMLFRISFIYFYYFCHRESRHFMDRLFTIRYGDTFNVSNSFGTNYIEWG